jgi:hypothetical protein
MKFYGLEIGCNEVFQASNNTEIITLTLFSEKDFAKTISIKKYALDSDYRKDPNLPTQSPEENKVASLKDMKECYEYVKIHFKILTKDFKSIQNRINLIFPSREYILLNNK